MLSCVMWKETQPGKKCFQIIVCLKGRQTIQTVSDKNRLNMQSLRKCQCIILFYTDRNNVCCCSVWILCELTL